MLTKHLQLSEEHHNFGWFPLCLLMAMQNTTLNIFRHFTLHPWILAWIEQYPGQFDRISNKMFWVGYNRHFKQDINDGNDNNNLIEMKTESNNNKNNKKKDNGNTTEEDDELSGSTLESSIGSNNDGNFLLDNNNMSFEPKHSQYQENMANDDITIIIRDKNKDNNDGDINSDDITTTNNNNNNNSGSGKKNKIKTKIKKINKINKKIIIVILLF
eukprot:UN00255